MTTTDQRESAERWFLERGLPYVLRPGALVRRVWLRSAPALAAFGVMMLFSIIVVRCFSFLWRLNVFRMGRCNLFRLFLYRTIVLISHAWLSGPSCFR